MHTTSRKLNVNLNFVHPCREIVKTLLLFPVAMGSLMMDIMPGNLTQISSFDDGQTYAFFRFMLSVMKLIFVSPSAPSTFIIRLGTWYPHTLLRHIVQLMVWFPRDQRSYRLLYIGYRHLGCLHCCFPCLSHR